MNEDDDQHLSLVIRGHLEDRANPKEPIDVHALAKSLAAHFKMQRTMWLSPLFATA